MSFLNIKDGKPWKSKSVWVGVAAIVLVIVEATFQIEISNTIYAVLGGLGLIAIRDAIQKAEDAMQGLNKD